MMFLQYAIMGIFLFPMGTFLTKTAGFSDAQLGDAYAMVAIGSIIAPFFIGLIADRFFAGQKVLGVLNLLGGVFLMLASMMAFTVAGGKPVPQAGLFKWLILAHFLCYMPTWALTNHIAMSQLDNPGKQFPAIRVFGTLGWFAVGLISLFQENVSSLLGFKGNIEETNRLMQFGAVISIASGLYAFFLPNTPPAGAGKKATLGEIMGTRALGLFKDWNFSVFAFCSFLVLFPGIFYFNHGNQFLNEIGMQHVMAKQTLGQASETLFMFAMPFFFARWGVKWMLMAGLVGWMARYGCFAAGGIGWPKEALLYAGLILHGVCYDFFFVTGQLYTDFKAPREVRASAQGLIYLITYGLGWFFSSTLAGRIVGKYSVEQGGKLIHQWSTIWLVPIVMAFAIMLIFMLFFHEKARVGQEAPEGEPAPAEREPANV
jgi:nucleoside transporter